MTEQLSRPVKLWHLILTAVLSAIGAIFGAGYALASRDYRLQAVEEQVRGVPKLERMVQRIGDKLNVSFEGIE